MFHQLGLEKIPQGGTSILESQESHQRRERAGQAYPTALENAPCLESSSISLVHRGQSGELELVRWERVGKLCSPLCFSILLVRMGSVLGGPPAVYIGASSVASHNSPPLKNKVHSSSRGLLLSHTTLSPWKLLRMVKRSLGVWPEWR